MKKVMIICISLMLLLVAGCQGEKPCAEGEAGKKVALETDTAKASYAIGYNMGQSIGMFAKALDMGTILQGFRDGVAGPEKAQMKVPDMQKALADFQKKAMKMRQDEMKAKGEKNQAEGKAFLEANAKKEGIVTTKSGLQYKVITEGEGATPTLDDKVKVHYRGTLIDGTQFDSSYDRGTPTEFPLQGIITGWREGLQLMKVGSKYQFFIPSNLAYGPRGNGREIGPNAVIIFDLELLEVLKVDKKAQNNPAVKTPTKKAPAPKKK